YRRRLLSLRLLSLSGTGAGIDVKYEPASNDHAASSDQWEQVLCHRSISFQHKLLFEGVRSRKRASQGITPAAATRTRICPSFVVGCRTSSILITFGGTNS